MIMLHDMLSTLINVTHREREGQGRIPQEEYSDGYDNDSGVHRGLGLGAVSGAGTGQAQEFHEHRRNQ